MPIKKGAYMTDDKTTPKTTQNQDSESDHFFEYIEAAMDTMSKQDVNTPIVTPEIKRAYSNTVKIIEDIGGFIEYFTNLDIDYNDEIAASNGYIERTIGAIESCLPTTAKLVDLVDEIADLDNYIQEELKKPEYEGQTIDELFHADTDQPKQTQQFIKVLREAREAKEAESKAATADEKKGLRTATRAGDIKRALVSRLATPTVRDYMNAITLLEEGRAYMSRISMDGLTFENGKLYFADKRIREVSETQLQELKTKEPVENINLPFLQFYYSQLLSEWEKAIKDRIRGGSGEIEPITRFYLPDLATARGLSKNASAESIEAIKKDIAAFHNIVGVIKEGYKNPSYYPVLNFEGYDSTTNTISISSPYLLHLIDSIYKVSVRRAKDGTPKLKSDGTPQQKPINSYLVHADIQKERNKAAVANVLIIIQGIETRGGNEGYRVGAETVISRNPLLIERLNESKNKRQLLQRVFKKTWELLRDKTDLQEKYNDIKLPDPNNPKNIPTEKDLSTFMIQIPHKGKKPVKEIK